MWWQRLRKIWPGLVLLGAWALFFWRFAAPTPSDRVTYPAGDFSQQFGVFRDVAYRALVAGRLPLWADCLWSGYPFHADPQAQIFYPPLWVVFGFLRALGWGHFPLSALVVEVSLHYLMVSVFLFLFLRSLKLRAAAAVLGALTFTYGGYLTGSPPLQTATLEVVTWLPLALLFVGKLAQTRQWPPLAWASLMLTLSFLAGHPQTFVYVALLTLAYFAFCARQAQQQARWNWKAFVGRAAALMGLTAALSAVQLLPSAHFILNSTRASVAFEQAGHGFPFTDVLQFFVTGLVSYWQPLYVGLLPLALAVFALARPNAQIRFWTGAALFGLTLSFGTKAVAYDALYWLVPGFGLFRDQERLALVVSLALAVLAAFGAHTLFSPLTRSTRRALYRLRRASGVLWVAAFGLLGVANYMGRAESASNDWKQLPERLGLLVLALGLAWLVLTLRAHTPAVRRWVPALGIAVVVLNLHAANRPLNVVPPYDPFPPSALVAPLQADAAFFRVQDDYRLPGHAGCAYGYPAIEGITPYQIGTYAHFLNSVPEPVRWQLLGVKYVVTWRAELRKPGFTEEVLAQSDVPDEKGNFSKTIRLDWEPRRAWLTHHLSLANEAEIFNRLAAPDFDPYTTALLSRPVDVSESAEVDSVIVTRASPGHMNLQTVSGGAGVLIISEAYFPGWRALVDGRPATLVRADGALLALPLSAGAHQIELAYQPVVLQIGAGLSGLGLLLTALLLGAKRAR